MLTVYLVRAGDIPITTDVPDIEAALALIGVSKKADNTFKSFETGLINDGAAPFEGLGVLSQDQDTTKKRKVNFLGMKGDSIIIGMERLDESTSTHSFTGLTKEQIAPLRKTLARASIFSGAFR